MAKTLLATASGSNATSVSFTSGIDSTYPVYEFHISNLEPVVSNEYLSFQMDSGSGYATSMYGTNFRSRHNEADTYALFENRNSVYGQAGGTAYQGITEEIYSNYYDSGGGIITIYNPSSTTSVKQFISEFTMSGESGSNPETSHTFCAGWFDTTSALTRIDFKFSSGNISSGLFVMYGVS